MGRMGASGGLTKSKLELATAVPGDVVAPATFYAGDKELKAGTLQEMSSITDSVSFATDSAKLYFRIPHGAYRTDGVAGYPEITSDRRGIAESLTFVPCLVVGGSGARVDANVNNDYINGVSTGNWGGVTLDKTFTVKKTGRYAFMASRHVGSGSSTMQVTVNGAAHNARFSFVQTLNAGASIRYYFTASATDWAVWGFCICYLG